MSNLLSLTVRHCAFITGKKLSIYFPIAVSRDLNYQHLLSGVETFSNGEGGGGDLIRSEGYLIE